MDYTRRKLLGLAGASVLALPLFLRDAAYADEKPRPPAADGQGPGKDTRVLDARKGYEQSKADEIHARSVRREIERAGEEPEEVKERVEERVRDLKDGLATRASRASKARRRAG